MPTFNQLVRKGRQTLVKKSTAPALQKGFNVLKKQSTDASSPQKRGVCTVVKHQHLRSLTQRFVNLPEFVSQMVLKFLLTFQAWVITYKSTAWFLSVVVVLKTFLVFVTTLLEVPLMLKVLPTGCNLVLNTVQSVQSKQQNNLSLEFYLKDNLLAG